MKQVDGREKLSTLHQQEPTVTAAVVNSNPNTASDPQALLSAQIEALPPLNLPVTPLLVEKTLDDCGSDTTTISSDNSSSVYTSGASSLSGSFTDKLVLLQEADFAAEGRYVVLQSQHDEQRRIWEWYLRKNKDDFIVDKYQNLCLWECTVPGTELPHDRPCIPPTLDYVSFYGENDCTLGQYIEKAISQAREANDGSEGTCPSKGCQQPLPPSRQSLRSQRSRGLCCG